MEEAQCKENQTRRKRKATAAERITYEDLEANFHLPLRQAACRLGVSYSTLKLVCREKDVKKWPFRQLSKASAQANTDGKDDDHNAVDGYNGDVVEYKEATRMAKDVKDDKIKETRQEEVLVNKLKGQSPLDGGATTGGSSSENHTSLNSGAHKELYFEDIKMNSRFEIDRPNRGTSEYLTKEEIDAWNNRMFSANIL